MQPASIFIPHLLSKSSLIIQQRLLLGTMPPEIIRILSSCLVHDETPSNRGLYLMAFCGVCRRWRDYGHELNEPLALDGCSDTQHGPKATLTRFRKASVAHKRDLFLGASRLLTGKTFLPA